MRTLALAAAALVASAGIGRADPLPLVGEPPTTYTPGVPFTFELRAPVLTGLTGYLINLTVEGDTVPPDLSVTAAPPSGPLAPQYPFPTTANFSALPGLDPASLDISDGADAPGVSTAQRNLLAVVTVTPGPDQTGPITVSITNAEFAANQDVTIDTPVVFTVRPETNPIPTPAAWVSLGIGGLILAGRRRFTRAVG